MKKSLSILIGMFFVLMLAACNSNAELVNKQDGSVNKEKSELTLMQVFEKTSEASKDLKSFKVKMDVKADISSTQDEAENYSTYEMDVVQNPMAFYQKLSTKRPASDEYFEMETYFTKDGMYINVDPTTKTWMKIPTKMMDFFLKVSDQQTNPVGEIVSIKKFVDDIKFQQDNKSYILFLNASGDKFINFLKENTQKILAEANAEATNDFNVKINKMAYEIHIDKKTFFPTVLNLNMEIETTTNGKTVKTLQDLKGQYEKHNQIKEITIPVEIIEGAEEITGL